MEAVTGLRLGGESAVLRDHARRLLVGRAYPGVTPRAGEDTRGVVYRGLDASTWRRLDAYEDDDYERRRCEVELDSGERVAADVYVIPSGRAGLLSAQRWDREGFERSWPSRLRGLLDE